MKKTLLYIMSMALVLTVGSCGDDDFTASIYDTNIPAVDTTKSTAEFDQWLYDNFVVPYNVEVQYKFNQPASDYSFKLAPANYERSQLIAHFIRYLFYDVYTSQAGENFMKQYGPRIFHFIGSSGYSPRTGTEVLGTASGGVKITLYNINEMKGYDLSNPWTGRDIETLNDRVFHTMHHEFSHILHQTKSYPVTFGQVTSGTYDPIDWFERDSVESHRMGYVTHYASSANYEDFVETLSCIITDTPYRWMMRLINATANGLSAGDREEIFALCDSLDIDIDAPNAHWNNFTLYDETEYNSQSGAYDLPTGRVVLDVHRNPEEVINKDYTKYVSRYRYTEKQKFTSFRTFVETWPYTTGENVAGATALLKKINIATTWHNERWGLHTFALRHDVTNRQNNINNYLANEVVIYGLK